MIPSVFGASALGWVATGVGFGLLILAWLAMLLPFVPAIVALDWIIRATADWLESVGNVAN